MKFLIKKKILLKKMENGFPMLKYKNHIIIVTGGNGRFAAILKKIKTKHKIYYPTKKELDITNPNLIRKYLAKKKATIVIHLAALSRPMNLHEKNITKSISLNIIGTSNITCACSDKKIKLIYFSTSYVYPGIKGNYKENASLKPINNYAWSKLGGECAVQLYKNSLILRVCMTEKPFIHKEAFSDVKTNFIYHEEIADMLLKLLHHRGVINVGGPIKSVYDFAKTLNPKIKKVSAKKTMLNKFPLNPSMNLSKLKKIISK